MRAVIVDSWAVMAYFQDEPAAEKVQQILTDAHKTNVRLMMSVVNAGEVWYNYVRRSHERKADERIEQLGLLGIEFVIADWALTRKAAMLKAKHAIAYADCFAAALAIREHGRVLTGDPEFEELDKVVQIEWL
jgi:ribonuclease VapC